ncbi:hypothetical protein JT06_17255 [Desulfobulbus sp. Tol-SR]|jgi:hypothetical protein|nr:hypothetical protein JT06_17255 [Desulfobulbus sp. Tol-SR]
MAVYTSLFRIDTAKYLLVTTRSRTGGVKRAGGKKTIAYPGAGLAAVGAGVSLLQETSSIGYDLNLDMKVCDMTCRSTIRWSLEK